MKDATSAAATTDPDWASDLVRNDIRGFMDDLAAVSIYGALYSPAASMSLEFGGANQSPSRAAIGQLSPWYCDRSCCCCTTRSADRRCWVGEGGVIPVKQAKLTSAVMNRFKLAVISAMTN